LARGSGQGIVVGRGSGRVGRPVLGENDRHFSSRGGAHPPFFTAGIPDRSRNFGHRHHHQGFSRANEGFSKAAFLGICSRSRKRGRADSVGANNLAREGGRPYDFQPFPRCFLFFPNLTVRKTSGALYPPRKGGWVGGAGGIWGGGVVEFAGHGATVLRGRIGGGNPSRKTRKGCPVVYGSRTATGSGRPPGRARLYFARGKQKTTVGRKRAKIRIERRGEDPEIPSREKKKTGIRRDGWAWFFVLGAPPRTGRFFFRAAGARSHGPTGGGTCYVSVVSFSGHALFFGVAVILVSGLVWLPLTSMAVWPAPWPFCDSPLGGRAGAFGTGPTGGSRGLRLRGAGKLHRIWGGDLAEDRGGGWCVEQKKERRLACGGTNEERPRGRVLTGGIMVWGGAVCGTSGCLMVSGYLDFPLAGNKPRSVENLPALFPGPGAQVGYGRTAPLRCALRLFVRGAHSGLGFLQSFASKLQRFGAVLFIFAGAQRAKRCCHVRTPEGGAGLPAPHDVVSWPKRGPTAVLL